MFCQKTPSLILGPLLLALACAFPSEPAAATYRAPTAKQGVTDLDYAPKIPLAQRYAALDELAFGLKIYNYFWAALENSNILSTADPLTCPGGTTRVPADPETKTAKGYFRYHCYNAAAIRQFDAMFALDRQHGMQTMVVLFNTPAMYRDPGCVASAEGLDVGCVPTDGHLDDYEDYVNFLADRYDGRDPAVGKISHFIVWNEVDSGTWFNLSPKIDVNHSLFDARQVQQWVDAYVGLFSRSARAVRRHSSDSLIEVSLDLHFIFNQARDGGRHTPIIGGKTILDGMWAQIGTRQDWSVAVHPYAEPAMALSPNELNFRNLPTLSAYQRQQLLDHGSHTPEAAQQYLMVASEQGWFDVPLSKRAGNLCKAHDLVMGMPNVLGTTHYFFQSRRPSDDHLAFIPFAAGEHLEDAAQLPTYQAYLATRPQIWGKSSDHYCCQQYTLGCDSRPGVPRVVRPRPRVRGNIDEVAWRNGRPVLRGWACDVGDPDSIYVHLYVNGPAGSGQFVSSKLASVASEPGVAAACQSHGTNLRFELDLSALRTSSPNALLYVHGISGSGGANNLLDRSGALHVPP